MSDIPLCSCGEFYQSHHPQCPARKYAEGLEAKNKMLEAQRVSQNKLITELTTDMEELESMLFVAYNNSGSGKSYFNWEHDLKESKDVV